MKYFNTGPLPFYFAMAISEKEFDKGCRRLGIEKQIFATKDACMHSFENKETGGLVCVVCIDAEKAKERSAPQIAALLAHEATHMWQAVCENMGESAPGREIEAYSIQWMTQVMLEHLEEAGAVNAN